MAVGLFGRLLHVTVRQREDGERAVRAALGGAGVEVEAVRAVPPSLEDVFVALVAAAGGALQG
jgi:hypothetical protein